jgi:predicted ATP-grasp superfamily ATP-dependent carboligase
LNKVLITDVRYRMSLAVIRSLGRKRVPVTAIEYDTSPKESALGFYSRYTEKINVLPNAALDEQGFISGIVKLASEALNEGSDRKPVLVPMGLDSLMAVSKNSEALKPYINFIVPPQESMDIANDTNRLLAIASKECIPCPETTTLLANETIEALSRRISYPAVIKYREGEILKFKPEKRYCIIKTPEDFIKAFTEMHEIQPNPIVQNYISGSGYGVSAVFDKSGEPLEIFCHRRLREYPVTGGPSCMCESIWDDRLIGYAIKLLKALNWTGVAMVEFKGDLDGDISLMEINPRFWGSLPLSVASQCDIPYAYYRAALGEEAKNNSLNWFSGRYKIGKKMRFLFQDLLSVRGYLKRENNKLRFLTNYFLELLDPRVADGVLEFKDWHPSYRYIIQALKKRKKGQQ